MGSLLCCAVGWISGGEGGLDPAGVLKKRGPSEIVNGNPTIAVDSESNESVV